MTLDVKAHLRELLAKATPGPWRVEQCEQRDADGAPYDVPCIVSEPSGAPDDGGDLVAQWGMSDADAALIVAAINALPALLDRLESKASALREVDRLVSEHCGADARAVLGPVLRAALDDEAPR